jgi:hypothetical protein
MAMVEDLFLTETFLIKGRVARKYHRLSKMLEDTSRMFLHVHDATMVSLRGNEVIRTPSVLVNMNEIVLAHELVDVAGDNAQRALAADGQKATRIRAFFSGLVQFEIAGRVAPSAYEPMHQGGRRFFVMQAPVLRGLNLEDNPDLRLLRGLTYAIVQKSRLSYVYDFGG